MVEQINPRIHHRLRIRMKMRSACVFLFVVPLLISAIAAAAPGPESQLKLIPEPKEVRVQEGSFHLTPTTRILVEFGHQSEDRIAAETLAEEIHDQSGLKLNITGAKSESKQEAPKGAGDVIVLARLQDRRVRQFLELQGLKADLIGEQGYLLFSDRSHLIVAANTGQGLFYGVQTLRQLLRADGPKSGLPRSCHSRLAQHGVEQHAARH
jgi:hexosaminidase